VVAYARFPAYCLNAEGKLGGVLAWLLEGSRLKASKGLGDRYDAGFGVAGRKRRASDGRRSDVY